MRPQTITISGLRSYSGSSPETIDWSAKNLVAVTGATGAGKSSIFEAITFALFGNCSWSEREISKLLAHGADEMSVELVFLHNSERWRILRTFYRNTRPSIHLLENFDTGEAFDNATTVNARITSLLGLTPKAFHLVALLHQGRFDSLLTASDAQRIVLLNELLGLEEMEQARDLVSQRLQGLERALGEARVARKDLEEDPAASAAQASAEAEAQRRRQAKAEEILGRIRILQGSWTRALRDKEALALARAEITRHAENDHAGTLARLMPVEDDLRTRETEILQVQAEIATQIEKAGQDIAALAAEGLTPDSLARADQTLSSASADVAQLREREADLATRAAEIADRRSQLAIDAEELDALAIERESAALTVLSSRTMLDTATKAGNDVRNGLGAAVSAAQSAAFARRVVASAATALKELGPRVQQAAAAEKAAEAVVKATELELAATSGIETAQQTLDALHDQLAETFTTGIGAKHLAAELSAILQHAGELAEDVNEVQTRVSAKRAEQARLQQAVSGFDAEEDRVDEASRALGEAVTQALAFAADVLTLQTEATAAESKLPGARAVEIQARQRLDKAQERAVQTISRLEKLRGERAAAALALHISPGDQCPVCSQNVPPDFRPPEDGFSGDLSAVEAESSAAKKQLADIQEKHAAAHAAARTALETKTALAAKLQEARARLESHINESTELYATASAALAAAGLDVTDDARTFRAALVRATSTAAALGGSPRVTLLRPIKKAHEALEESHDALRAQAADTRTETAELEAQAKNLSSELRKIEKSANAALRKAEKANGDYEAAVNALNAASTQAAEALAAVGCDSPQHPAEFVSRAIASIDNLAGQQAAPARERTKAARVLLTPFRTALEEASALRHEHQRAVIDASQALTAAAATAKSKSEEHLRASQDLAEKRLAVDQEDARCAARLGELKDTYGLAQTTFLEAGCELSLGVEEFAATCRSIVDDLATAGERSGDEQPAGTVLAEIDATLKKLAVDAEACSKKEAGLTEKHKSRSAELEGKKTALEASSAQWDKDRRAAESTRRQYIRRIDSLPEAYRSMLDADPLKVTEAEAEQVRNLVTATISEISSLGLQVNAARKQGEDLERSRAALQKERDRNLRQQLSTTYESLRHEIADIVRRTANVDDRWRPQGPPVPDAHELTVTTLQRFAEATAAHRAGVLEEIEARETSTASRTQEAATAINALRIELEQDEDLGFEGNLTDATALEDLTAVRELARARAENAEEQRDRALGQIPRAGALDDAITAAATRAGALENVKKLLQKDKFLAYVTSRRTMALLGLASTLFDTLSSGQFGFAADFQIVERPTGAVRDPKTLSGGEKFLASLALALSLVEMYSRSGPRIGALFLDEGFASLDEDTLDVALEVVRRQAGGDRLVVVISHLHAVAEAVTDVLMVEKPATGSRTRWLTGPERDALLDEELRAGLLTVT